MTTGLPARLACLELAETILEAEFARTGTEPSTSARALSLATAIQEAIEAWHRAQADDAAFDREARRPNEPPEPFADDLDAWESRCNGNMTMTHLAPSAKLAHAWRCGSCGRWLHLPKGRT